MVMLSELASIQTGYQFRQKVADDARGAYFVIQLRDIDKYNALNPNTLARVSLAHDLTPYTVQSGDVLLVNRGQRNHAVAITELPGPAIAVSNLFIIRITATELLPAYLAWYLNQRPVQEYLHRASGQNVIMPVVRRAVVAAIELPLPALDLQRNIAALDALGRHEQELLAMLAQKRREYATRLSLKVVGYA